MQNEKQGRYNFFIFDLLLFCIVTGENIAGECICFVYTDSDAL